MLVLLASHERFNSSLPLSMCTCFSSEYITHVPSWKQYLALFMALTVNKESAPTTDRPHVHITSSNPIDFITWPQMINSDFSM